MPLTARDVQRRFSLFPGRHLEPSNTEKGLPAGHQIQIDLPMDEARYVPVGIRYAGPGGRVSVRPTNENGDLVEAFWQSRSVGAFLLERNLLQNSQGADLEAVQNVLDGAAAREALRSAAGSRTLWTTGQTRILWLKVSSQGIAPSGRTLQLTDTVELALTERDESESTTLFSVRLIVWRVGQSVNRPVPISSTDVTTSHWTGGGDLAERLGFPAIRRLRQLVSLYAEMGGGVMVDGTIDSADVLGELGSTLTQVHLDALRNLPDRPLSAFAPQQIEQIVGQLPQLDFSRYRRWHQTFLSLGIRNAQVTVYNSPEVRGRVLRHLADLGDDPTGETIGQTFCWIWLYREYRRHLRSLGFERFTAKVGDEPGEPHQIPQYLDAAKAAGLGGWKPLVNPLPALLNPDDLGQLAGTFEVWSIDANQIDRTRSLSGRTFDVQTRRIDDLAGPWTAFVNGLAESTWARTGVFADGSTSSLFPFSSADVRAARATVFRRNEGPIGRLCETRFGTGWGNLDEDVFFISAAGSSAVWMGLPPDETPRSPGDGRAEVRVQLEVERLEPSDSGEAPFTLDRDPQLWMEVGASEPYSVPYGTAWAWPVLAWYQECQAWSFYTFFRWENPHNVNRRVVWLIPRTGGTFQTEVSPAWCGHRDGTADARLFDRVRRLDPTAIHRMISRNQGAPVSVEPSDPPARVGDLPFPEDWTRIEPPSLENANLARRLALQFLFDNERV